MKINIQKRNMINEVIISKTKDEYSSYECEESKNI